MNRIVSLICPLVLMLAAPLACGAPQAAPTSAEERPPSEVDPALHVSSAPMSPGSTAAPMQMAPPADPLSGQGDHDAGMNMDAGMAMTVARADAAHPRAAMTERAMPPGKAAGMKMDGGMPMGRGAGCAGCGGGSMPMPSNSAKPMPMPMPMPTPMPMPSQRPMPMPPMEGEGHM